MNFSDFFIRRPIFAGVLSTVIFILGLIAMWRLPISEYPEVVPPTIVVRATYPGANPKTIAETVASPLEQAVNGVEDSLYMFSQATGDGVITLTVTFKLGTDRVSQALPKLPEEVRRLGVTTVKQSPDLTLVVHLFSPNDRYDEVYLRNYATLQVKDVLARIPGAGDVEVFGSGDYAMRVWLQPDKIAARNLTASDVVDAIREQNVQVAAGAIGQQPVSRPVEFELQVNAKGRLISTEEFGQIIVKTGPNGEKTLLKDVARLDLGASGYSLRSLLNNKTAVALPIFQSPGANALQLSKDVRRSMEELKKNFPDGVDYSAVYDPTVFVRRSIEAVVHTLLEAILLARFDHSAGGGARVTGRRVCRDARVWLQHQRAVALRSGAGHRDRGGRRHRGRRERRTKHRARVVAFRCYQARHARGHQPDCRHRPGALRGVRADGVHQRPDRPVLQTIRNHHRHFHGHFRVQLADAFPGVVRGLAQAPPQTAAR